MNIRRIKLLVITVLLFFMTSSLFAVEEYISNIYKQLDHVFIIKSEDELNKILSMNNEDRYYYLIENYTEKKIRRLIINNDYDFAMTAIVIVIENNLDNEHAVEMYSVIADAYEVQKSYAEEQEQKKQVELARREMEKEKQRDTVEKEYVAAKVSNSSKSVYVAGKETNLTSSDWKVLLGLVNLMDLYDAAAGFNSFHYGISADFRYEYTLENKTVIGADVLAAGQFLAIAEKENTIPLTGEAEFVVKGATPVISKDLFLRFGCGAMFTGKSDYGTNTVKTANSMFTPVLGIKMERIKIGNAEFDIGADWYAGHLFYKDINFAAGANANVAIPFAELDKIKLNLNVGVRDKFLLKETGIENRASLILAVGVENVIR